MSKKTTTEVNMMHIPAFILGGLFLLGAGIHGGFGLLFFLGACIASAYMNYNTIYKFFEEGKKGHPREWSENMRAETLFPYFMISCVLGTAVSTVAAILLSMLIWNHTIIFIVILALYHWMLSNYADRYGYKKEES